MKFNFKIFIISSLILQSGLTMAYGYWTDIIQSEINFTIPYDVYLQVVNITVPEAVIEQTQEETLEPAEEIIIPKEGEDEENTGVDAETTDKETNAENNLEKETQDADINDNLENNDNSEGADIDSGGTDSSVID